MLDRDRAFSKPVEDGKRLVDDAMTLHFCGLEDGTFM